MKLPFMLKFAWGEETHFIEKLWATKVNEYSNDLYNDLYVEYLNRANKCGIWLTPFKVAPKLHTIRNQSDRLKVGQYVQPFVWTYKPYKRNPDPTIPAQFDFMPPLKLVSKQRFDLKFVNTEFGKKAMIYIDGRLLEYESEYEELAVNDGFDDADRLFRHFNKPVENMEIRHFTNLKY